MTNRALLRELPILAVVLEVAAVVLLALAMLAVVVAVVMYRSGDVMMALPSTSFAMADYLSLPQITTLVPHLTDGNLPSPSL